MFLFKRNLEKNNKNYEIDADCVNPRLIMGGSYGMRSQAQR